VTVVRLIGWGQLTGIPKSIPIGICLVSIRYNKTTVFGIRDAISVDVRRGLGKAGLDDHEETSTQSGKGPAIYQSDFPGYQTLELLW
jgi:hypothetical protein